MLDNFYRYVTEFGLLFIGMDFWGWMTLAFVLVIIELLSGTLFLLWLAIAAGLIAVVKLFVVIPVNGDWAFFACVSVVSLVSTYCMFSQEKTTENKTINQRGRKYIGQIVVLSMPIVEGKSRIHIDGVWWSVAGSECSADTKVRIIDTDGTVLVVEKYESD